MPMMIKRIEKLEKATPNKTGRPIGNGMGDFYKYLETPEGQADMEWLYGTEEEQQRLMAEHQKDLKRRGLL